MLTNDHRLLFCTCPDQETALGLAERLVEERLAACASLVPGILSVYRWEDRVQQDAEVLMTIKTTRQTLDRLVERIRELHPYEVPEIIAIPITEGSADYLNWVTTCTREQD